MEELYWCSEIQLKSPNWLFGQRKLEENVAVPKAAPNEASRGASQGEANSDGICDLNWLSSLSFTEEENIFQR